MLALTEKDDADGFCVLTHASDDIADAHDMKLTHLTDAGREAFFAPDHALKYRRAWGKAAPVLADAFVTGEAVVAKDWQTVDLRIQAFDRNDPKKLATVVDKFTTAVDPRTLTECGVSFVHRKGAKDDEDDTPKKVLDSVSVAYRPGLAAAEAPPTKEQEKDWDELLLNSPVRLEILYGGKPVPIHDGVVETPRAGQTVQFRLKNVDPDKDSKYGVVLKVNGDSTIERQRLPAQDCYKWVLARGKEITLDGFQRADATADKFEVLPPAESREKEVNYGDNVGAISLVVFRAARTDDEKALAQNEAKRNQDVKAVSRGSLAYKDGPAGAVPPDSLAALKNGLTLEADPTQKHDGQKGLIVAGPVIDSAIEPVPFVLYPREQLSLVVRYYTPGK